LSEYRLQIIQVETGKVVLGWQPGDHVETDLADDLTQRVKAKGVGLFKREEKVLSGVREAFAEMLLDLKRRV
jgi:hypothetical protein